MGDLFTNRRFRPLFLLALQCALFRILTEGQILGEIEFDAKSREIRLAAAMNMPEGGPIEYLLVHESGKVHESMLVTKARPLHRRASAARAMLTGQAITLSNNDGSGPRLSRRRRHPGPH